MGVVAEEAFLVVFHPEVLLPVDIDTFHRVVHAQIRLQRPSHVTLELLGHRVVDTIVHALLQPQLPVVGLHNLVGIVVAHRRGVALVRIEGLHTVTVITVQSIGRANPYKAFRVAVDAVYLRVRKTVAGVEPAELHLRDGSLHGDRPQQGHHHQAI